MERKYAISSLDMLTGTVAPGVICPAAKDGDWDIIESLCHADGIGLDIVANRTTTRKSERQGGRIKRGEMSIKLTHRSRDGYFSV